MAKNRLQTVSFLLIQLLVVAAFAAAYIGLSTESKRHLKASITEVSESSHVSISRETPLEIAPLYDDPELVSDEELAGVLKKIRPVFNAKELKPNFVEHALRTWGVHASFDDEQAMSGTELRDILIDHGRFLKSWNQTTAPLLIDRPEGIAIRWDRKPGGSVHHDHWLACLTEAGITLNTPVYAPSRRNMTVENVLDEALRDFRLDEKEVEWSAMAFGLWLPPTKSWKNRDGREISFDQIGKRLMRGHKRYGVCSGTHRVYSVMLLLRLDDEFQILSQPVRDEMYGFLERVRDLITVSQFADGHWPSNWSDGEQALTDPVDDANYKKVIATGHHLEWLAIAPKDLHPPREMILKAAQWVIRDTLSQPESLIRQQYTFYSHVGNALALWRNTRPADFWSDYQQRRATER